MSGFRVLQDRFTEALFLRQIIHHKRQMLRTGRVRPAISDFLSQYKVTSGLMIFDKGFHNDALFEYIDKNKDLAALIPLKSDSKLIGKYGMDNPVDILEGYTDGTVMSRR